MPRVNLAINPQDVKIVAKISEYMTLRKTDVKGISKGTGIPASTIYGWLRNIGLIQVENLRRIYDFLRVPQSERII